MKRSMVQRARRCMTALLAAAAVSVGFLQGSMSQPVSAEGVKLSDFEGMFDAYSTNRNIWDDFFKWPKPVAVDNFAEDWTVNADGMLESTGGGKMNLLYTKEKYTDFTMTFRYKHGPDENGAAHLYVGIGAPESGATLGANGELLEHSPTLLRIYQVGSYQYAPTSDGKDSWYGPGNLFKDETAKNAVHTVTISVTGSTMTMKVDGQPMGALALTNYEGGHIFFGAGMTVDAIGLPEIEDRTPTNDFDGFSSYYTERVGSDKLVSAEPTDYWIENEGTLLRDVQAVSGSNEGDWNETANHLNNMAYLFIEGEYTGYENYTVELDYTMGSGAWGRAYIGFGATENVTWRQKGGGTVFFTDSGGATCFEGNMNENGKILRSEFGTTLEGFDPKATHHLKFTFRDGIVTLEVDGTEVRVLTQPDYMAGGRIFLASNSTGTTFSNIKIAKLSSVPDGAAFAGYDEWYSADIRSEALEDVAEGTNWSIDGGIISRKAVDPALTDSRNYLDMAYLYLSDKTYTNFKLELDYKHGYSGWHRSPVGFGAELGKHFMEENGGVTVLVQPEAIVHFDGNINTNGEFEENVFWAAYDENGNNLTVISPYDANAWHHLSLTVQDGYATLTIDEFPYVYEIPLPSSYNGGYLYLCSNSVASQYKNIVIEDLSVDIDPGAQAGWTPTAEDIAFDFSGRQASVDVFQWEYKEIQTK